MYDTRKKRGKVRKRKEKTRLWLYRAGILAMKNNP